MLGSTLAFVACIAGAQQPMAAPIAIRKDVTYAASVRTVPAQCDWKDRFVERVVADAGGRAVVARTGDQAAAAGYLTIEVTYLQVAAGGHFSNKGNWILIHGTLTADGQRIDGFDFRRTYTDTLGACAAARELATMLVADVAGWLRTRPVAAPVAAPTSSPTTPP